MPRSASGTSPTSPAAGAGRRDPGCEWQEHPPLAPSARQTRSWSGLYSRSDETFPPGTCSGLPPLDRAPGTRRRRRRAADRDASRAGGHSVRLAGGGAPRPVQRRADRRRLARAGDPWSPAASELRLHAVRGARRARCPRAAHPPPGRGAVGRGGRHDARRGLVRRRGPRSLRVRREPAIALTGGRWRGGRRDGPRGSRRSSDVDPVSLPRRPRRHHRELHARRASAEAGRGDRGGVPAREPPRCALRGHASFRHRQADRRAPPPLRLDGSGEPLT